MVGDRRYVAPFRMVKLGGYHDDAFAVGEPAWDARMRSARRQRRRRYGGPTAHGIDDA